MSNKYNAVVRFAGIAADHKVSISAESMEAAVAELEKNPKAYLKCPPMRPARAKVVSISGDPVVNPVSMEEADDFAKALKCFLVEAGRPNANVELQLGGKRARIVVHDGNSCSAYGFIDMSNGDILKAASWKAPAKGVRGNIRRGARANQWNNACGLYSVAYLR